jgi:membrane-bound lytic murein transglycosylase D
MSRVSMSVSRACVAVVVSAAVTVCSLSPALALTPATTSAAIDKIDATDENGAGQQSDAVSHAASLAQIAAAPVPQASNARDSQLIANVEKAYAEGLSNYEAAHAQAARANFDYAVDLLLSSGIDLKNDAALSAELDRVVDSINTLELDALREGGQETAQEAAPVDVANDVTFPVDPNVKAQAIEELRTTQSDLPLVINDYVASFINFFENTQKGRNTIIASLDRAGRYRDMIQRVLKEEGVPQDLVYQAVAESGFRPQAVNAKSGAAGMWQFMPYGTYGLAKTGWYDERFDPEKATRAYAREMKKAYNQLGDWYLAMAAYDWGTGNIQRAVQRTGYVDFWELYRRNNLPGETKNYVPIILAVAIMAKNPKQYGLQSITPDAAIAPDSVTTNYAVDLKLVADLTGTSEQTIEELNPSLLRGRTPPDEPYELHVPAGTKDLFGQRIAEIPEDKRTSWRYHRLSSGETVEEVARTFHTGVPDIEYVNQLGPDASLTGMQALIIPVTPARGVTGARVSVYKARRGDTLVTIADQFGVTVEELKEWNHITITARSLTSGRKLYVAEPARVVRTRSARGNSGTQTAHTTLHAATSLHSATKDSGGVQKQTAHAAPHASHREDAKKANAKPVKRKAARG